MPCGGVKTGAMPGVELPSSDGATTQRNVELKASDGDPERSLAICQALDGATDHGILWQRDTYFVVPRGRLKLREQRPGVAKLIQYDRDDRPEERTSSYLLADVGDPEAMLATLTAALAVRLTVTKHRHLFIWGPVRIHLDQVDELGHFIEFEAVATENSDLSHEQRLVAELRARFNVTDDRLIPIGYADLLAKTTP